MFCVAELDVIFEFGLYPMFRQGRIFGRLIPAVADRLSPFAFCYLMPND